MDIPAKRWMDAIPKRHSRRQYDGRPIAQDILAQLEKTCNEFRPFPAARAVLVKEDAEKVFKGIIGNYGTAHGAPGFIAFIGDMSDPHVQEAAGYTGEGIILEIEALGLGSCWLAGGFRPDVAKEITGAKENEKVLCVTPVGYPAGNYTFAEKIQSEFGRSHRRKALSQLVSGLQEFEWPEWTHAALEMARLSPSAMNRQPWRFFIERNSLTVSVDSSGGDLGVSKRLDCGIAMLHIEVAALASGVSGKWEFLDPPRVARFKLI